MTRAEIFAIPAGRPLDCLVVEHVMGWKEVKDSLHGWTGLAPAGWGRFPVPFFSTDIAEAWEVVDKLRAEDCQVVFWLNKIPEKVRVLIEPCVIVDEETFPVALCRCALLRVFSRIISWNP